MRNDVTLCLACSLLLGGLGFLSTGQWYLGLGVGVLALIASFLVVIPCVRAYGEENRKRHECYLFIHGFLVTLSVCVSLDKAFESASEPMGKEFHALDETLATMEAKDKVTYLTNYFGQNIYAMFLSVLDLYLNRGGDVLKLSSELTAEASRVEETGRAYQKMAARKATGFAFLWIMAAAIMGFMRFGLSSFFSQLTTNFIYLAATCFFYLFLLGSAVVYVSFLTKKTPWQKKGGHHGKAQANSVLPRP